MRNTAIMNGALIGFGLGFILASIALYRLVSDYVPQYANTWYFQGIAIVGGAGLIVGIITVSAGFLYAIWASKKWPIPLRDSADISKAELETLAQKGDSDLPGIWISLTPIILPIILIAGKTLYYTFFNTKAVINVPRMHQVLAIFFTEFGDPNIALSLAAAIALGTFVWQKRSDK